jgi:multiple sugar transport system substrate-binding protein
MRKARVSLSGFLVVLLLAGFSSALAAQGKTKLPYEGVTINYIGYGGLWTKTVIDSLAEFKAKTGIEVKAQQLGNDQISQKIAISSTAHSGDLDVFAFRPLQETLLFVKNGWLEPLDGYIAKSPEFDYNDFMKSARDGSTNGGKIFGIPMMTEREVVFYNKELFAKAGIKTMPKTMDELMAAAEKLNDPKKGICGIAIRGKGSDAVTMFSGFLRGFGGEFNANGKALINTPQAIAAFKYYGDLLRLYGPPGVLNMGWAETQALFAQGRAAMRIDADSQFGFSIDPKSSLVYDKVGYFSLPAGPAGQAPFNVAAWSLGVSPYSQNKEAAWEFVRWCMGKEMDARTQASGNPSTRSSTWKNLEASKGFPSELISVINETSAVGRATDRPSLINVGESRTVIGDVIVAGILGRDVKPVADKANAAFQTLLDKEK